jgi:hypothetical protein
MKRGPVGEVVFTQLGEIAKYEDSSPILSVGHFKSVHMLTLIERRQMKRDSTLQFLFSMCIMDREPTNTVKFVPAA